MLRATAVDDRRISEARDVGDAAPCGNILGGDSGGPPRGGGGGENLLPALAYAVDDGAPGADAA